MNRLRWIDLGHKIVSGCGRWKISPSDKMGYYALLDLREMHEYTCSSVDSAKTMARQKANGQAENRIRRG